MAKLKIYECCICHTILKDYKPIRLVKQKYEVRGYGQYRNKKNYDFCTECYKKFNGWIHKHNKEVNNDK